MHLSLGRGADSTFHDTLAAGSEVPKLRQHHRGTFKKCRFSGPGRPSRGCTEHGPGGFTAQLENPGTTPPPC